jgi:hypothetical protein
MMGEGPVSARKVGKPDAIHPIDGDGGHHRWPAWARYLASAALLYQMAAVLTAALAGPPAFSPLELDVAKWFEAYQQLTDQGYAYRFYAPEPGATPVVTATIRYADGRPEETVRLPTRGVWPRLRYQRQLALAQHLFNDFEAARTQTGDGSKSRWALSFARHLCRSHPGSSGVSLRVQMHMIPDLREVHDALERPGGHVDLDAEEFFTVPERIGDYPCDAS